VADIPVKPRKTAPPWWLWVALALVLAGLAWFALDFFNDDEAEADRTEAVDLGAARVPGAVPLAFAPVPLNPTR